MTIDLLALIVGVILSLMFSYVPGLAPKFQALIPETKRLIMAALLFLSAAAVYGLSCGGVLESLWPGLGIACTQIGALALVRIFILSLVANQGTFSISPQVAHRVQLNLEAKSRANAPTLQPK
jgi:hypothetical protein